MIFLPAKARAGTLVVGGGPAAFTEAAGHGPALLLQALEAACALG
jgi:hypothetical protein